MICKNMLHARKSTSSWGLELATGVDNLIRDSNLGVRSSQSWGCLHGCGRGGSNQKDLHGARHTRKRNGCLLTFPCLPCQRFFFFCLPFLPFPCISIAVTSAGVSSLPSPTFHGIDTQDPPEGLKSCSSCQTSRMKSPTPIPVPTNNASQSSLPFVPTKTSES